ncbi:MBOAT family O-acyltransferase [Legionella parisiensis]|uniref:MBOAT family O-acyltransferase n=1 Tax=Legionella parisiensis TaxID=45071 RepID=UPI0009E8CB1A
MTLSKFLRDYLYIPLGGDRRGLSRRYLNLMTTRLLGGMWHGAERTFIIWGELHGIYLVSNHFVFNLKALY